ncbi:unnamed protein product [Gordionus sp. m RMFG-2023]
MFLLVILNFSVFDAVAKDYTNTDPKNQDKVECVDIYDPNTCFQVTRGGLCPAIGKYCKRSCNSVCKYDPVDDKKFKCLDHPEICKLVVENEECSGAQLMYCPKSCESKCKIS